MSESNLAPRFAQISERLMEIRAALDRIERNQSDPEEIRQALNDIAANYVLTTQLAELAGIQRGQILEVVTWMRQRMSGDALQQQFEDVLFQTRQLVSIIQGWRDDEVLMRADIRALRGVIEAVLARREDGASATTGSKDP